MNNDLDEWIISAKKALNWFIEVMGDSEWNRRRKNVVDYFNQLDKTLYTEETVQQTTLDKLFRPVALYDDWLAWYMYLIESLVIRPYCDEPAQSARIYPFFSAIGRRVEALKKMPGIEQRMQHLLNENQNQPDSTLYELVVALCYFRNGWEVTFLNEDKSNKSPDLVVCRSGQRYFLECKRLAKVNDYSEKERLEWQKKSKFLFDEMQKLGIPTFAQIVFKTQLENLPDNILIGVFLEYLRSGNLKAGLPLSTPDVNFILAPIDFERVSQHFAENSVRMNSPDLIHLLTGEYDFHGNYTVLTAPTRIETVGENDGLHILNNYIGGLSTAFVAKWECVSLASIDLKAKDIKKVLSKAVSQIPDGEPGIIHIGYETVNGPFVELKRAEKLVNTIQSFNYGTKNIKYIFCNAIQPLMKIGEWECAETTSYFGENANFILPEILLLDPPDTSMSDSTHWYLDISNMKK